MATKRKSTKKPTPPEPGRCPQCGGRIMVHWGKGQCTVPGCDWKGDTKA